MLEDELEQGGGQSLERDLEERRLGYALERLRRAFEARR